SRLLWSGLLPSCSLGTLETQVLNRKREGDIPGALAPQIWFDFLREGPRGSALDKLYGVCDHNMLDIVGLSSLFGMVLRIGSDPVGAIEERAFHLDRLALLWPEEKMRRLLLQEAALRGSLRARYELARIARRSGEWERYRSLMEETADAADSVFESAMVPRGAVLLWRLRANIQLASYYEWKARDYEAAIIRTCRAAALLAELSAERLRSGAKAASPSINMKLEERLNRLLAKQQNGGP
ncbi:MAG: ribonuclease H-like domain-containing protein, partial [Treponema sp.]|nr:ribonuclease H-like domain-containing protein [Treponema sp.]